MLTLGKLNELEEWFEEQSFEHAAAIAMRVALRGLRPLFGDAASIERSSNSLRSVNMALVHLVMPGLREKTRILLENSNNPDSITQANIAVERVKHYEAATARRQSRASSSTERFADGVLRRAASETVEKYKKSKSRAEIAIAMALGQMSTNLVLGVRDGLGLVGLMSRVQSSHQRVLFWDCISTDCAFVESGGTVTQLFSNTLWSSSSEDALITPIELSVPGSFWAYWYAGFVQGAPLDWDLLSDIALIDATTDMSDESQAMREISHIELHYLRSRAYQPERIERDESTGLFTVVPENAVDRRRYENALRKIQEDINRIREVENTNSYSALIDICEILQNTIDLHKNEPMFVHDDFVKALKMIIRRIERQELPPFDDAIENLVDDLNTGSIDIRAMDEGVATAVASRAKIKLRKPNPYEERSLLSQIILRSAQSDKPLAEQLRSDATVIQAIDPNGKHESHPEPEQAVQRIANRLPQMQAEDSENMQKRGVDRAVDTAEKAAKLQKGAEAVGTAAEQGWGWLQYLISMF